MQHSLLVSKRVELNFFHISHGGIVYSAWKDKWVQCSRGIRWKWDEQMQDWPIFSEASKCSEKDFGVDPLTGSREHEQRLCPATECAKSYVIWHPDPEVISTKPWKPPCIALAKPLIHTFDMDNGLALFPNPERSRELWWPLSRPRVDEAKIHGEKQQ